MFFIGLINCCFVTKVLLVLGHGYLQFVSLKWLPSCDDFDLNLHQEPQKPVDVDHVPLEQVAMEHFSSLELPLELSEG